MREKSRLDRITQFTTLATLISIILGIGISVNQIRLAVSSATSTLEAVKLQALSHISVFLDQNFEVRRTLVDYLDGQLPRDIKVVGSEIERGRSGELLYYSDQLESYRHIMAHYERLGAILDLKYLEFDIVFEIVPFPDRFWEESRELRTLISENWHAPDQPLADLHSNFRKLCLRYQQERAARGLSRAQPADCRSS